jgi:23S rRNA (uracil1939-C5)-methyltransferase
VNDPSEPVARHDEPASRPGDAVAGAAAGAPAVVDVVRDVDVGGLVAGGEALARLGDGRRLLVDGALPGEVVDVALRSVRPRLARAAVVGVRRPAPTRVQPPCPFVAAGCGGCDLQHAAPDAQVGLKVGIVVDALRHLGGVVDPPVEAGAALPDRGFRTALRLGVRAGRAGFRRRRSHDVLAVEECLVAHPALSELLAEGRYGRAQEVTLRVGAVTGERLAVLHPTARGAVLPADVTVVGTDELRRGRRAWFHDEVAGRRYRISALSFFQTRTDGAAALVQAVTVAGGDELADAGRVVDAYGGVGLFAAALARPGGAGRRVVLVERSASSCADARRNLSGLDARVVNVAVERWRPGPADVVVADPARAGLGRVAVDVVAATGAAVAVLVSCDAAALARDTRLLGERGYELAQARVVDLFPHTHHVEVVSRFVRR